MTPYVSTVLSADTVATTSCASESASATVTWSWGTCWLTTTEISRPELDVAVATSSFAPICTAVAVEATEATRSPEATTTVTSASLTMIDELDSSTGSLPDVSVTTWVIAFFDTTNAEVG